MTQVLGTIQAAWPLAAIIGVVILGLVWASESQQGRQAVVTIALKILEAFAKGVEVNTLPKLDQTSRKLEARLTPPERTLWRQTGSTEKVGTRDRTDGALGCSHGIINRSRAG